MNAAEQRGGRYVLWGARVRDIQIGGAVDRLHNSWFKKGSWTVGDSKRGKRVGW